MEFVPAEIELGRMTSNNSELLRKSRGRSAANLSRFPILQLTGRAMAAMAVRSLPSRIVQCG